jgi:hypothetical protein
MMQPLPEEDMMTTEKKHGNREFKKQKKSVPKTNASAPSTKETGRAAVKTPNKK